MTLLKTVVIVCLIGCSLAAPRPVDWDEWGRKLKGFGDQVRTKYHEVKEKVLPAARTACEFVNTIPSNAAYTSFRPQGYYPGRGFGGSPSFPHNFQHTISFHRGGFPDHHFFHHKPFNTFPDFNHPPHRGFNTGFQPAFNPGFNPGFKPGFRPGFAPWSPTTSTSTPTTTSTSTPTTTSTSTTTTTSTTEGLDVGFNPSNSGFNPVGTDFSGSNSGSDSGLNPSSDDGFGTFNGGSDSSNDGFNPSSGGSNPSGDGFDIFNSGFDSSNDGFNPSSGGSNPSNDGFGTSNGGSNPSNDGFGSSNDGFNPVGPEAATPSITGIDLSPSDGGLNPFDVGVKPSDDGFNPFGNEPQIPLTSSISSLDPSVFDSNPDDKFGNDIGGGDDMPSSFDPSRRTFKNGHSPPDTALEQFDLNLGEEIPPFIPPGDDNGLDNSDEEVTNDNRGNIDFRKFGNRFYK